MYAVIKTGGKQHRVSEGDVLKVEKLEGQKGDTVVFDAAAFQLGEHAIGLQFHLEMTAESLRAIIDNCRAELVPARWIQDEAAILGHAEGHFAATHALMDRLLGWLTRR